ncbi:tyrosine-type recombinase/integrase [Acuticoccus sp. MNP-M23]|uniref:tyrosine-type recombinase/integrase n=1 Tax=Acuticoccus sp. MNP-M23 TaxID=3072793 RepID=UPI002816313F|nr:integrase arm-type DNA-binding domain-containing protein [Acuticoccus sp. MNP-M23]WMS43119.1 tyrosine-type recombinase/integrase [Acuticoccus sp. MNP-M23]
MATVKAARVPGKYHDGTGCGLFLKVDKAGRKAWVQRIIVAQRRREIGLGSWPLVSLAEARDAALDNKRATREGIDPLAERRKAKPVTFAEATRRAHEELAPTWKNQRDRDAFLASHEKWTFPRFGEASVRDVTSADIRQAILAARAATPEIGRKLSFRTSAVFKWCIAEGLRDDNPATPQALALPRMEAGKNHRKALPYADVKDCVAAVHASGAHSTTKLALEFLVLTASRSGEVRGARWEEMDRKARVWTVPPERMKSSRTHRIPLSDRAIAIIDLAADAGNGSELVFPSARGLVISDMTLSKLIKGLGFNADVHGFRTSFRTWAQECSDAPWEVAEAALAHAVGDKVERAYARSDFFAKRRALMDGWAAFCGGAS